MSISNLKKWIAIFILPIVFIFLIFNFINDIKNPKEDLQLNEGRVSEIGFTERISYRRITTKTDVFYLKLKNDHTKYSYFNRNSNNYRSLINELKKGDFVKIYNEGFDKKQNTISIIQLEKQNNVLISKSEDDKMNYILILLFTIALIFYVIVIYYKLKSNDQTSNFTRYR